MVWNKEMEEHKSCGIIGIDRLVKERKGAMRQRIGKYGEGKANTSFSM